MSEKVTVKVERSVLHLPAIAWEAAVEEQEQYEQTAGGEE